MNTNPEQNTEDKVAKDAAILDFEAWMDYKKVTPEVREKNKSAIETLVGAIRAGVLVINADKTITHNLLWPTEGEKPVTALTYKARMTAGAAHSRLKQYDADDADGRIFATAAALAAAPDAIIKNLDKEDFKITQALVLGFFI